MNEVINATWHLALSCVCPECGQLVDLLQKEDFWDGKEFKPCENGTEATRNVGVECPECHAEFRAHFDH